MFAYVCNLPLLFCNPIRLQISHNSRCESFWVRAGFESLYDTYDFQTGQTYRDYERGDRVPGDNMYVQFEKLPFGSWQVVFSQKLGTLAFTMRDELVAQVRQRTPMKVRFVCDAAYDENNYSGYRPDRKCSEHIVVEAKRAIAQP